LNVVFEVIFGLFSGARIPKSNRLQEQQLKNSGVHQPDPLVISLIWTGKWHHRSNTG